MRDQLEWRPSSVAIFAEGALHPFSSPLDTAPLPLYPDQLRRLRAPKERPSPAAPADLGFEPRPFRAGLSSLAGEPERGG